MRFSSYRFIIWTFVLFGIGPSLGRAYTSSDYYQAGLSFYQQKDYSKAIQYLKASAQMDPQNWQAEQVLGYSYYMTGDTTEALAAFDRSLQINPGNPNLKGFADNLRAKNAVGSSPVTSATAPPPGSETAETAPAGTRKPVPPSIPVVFSSGRWANFHLGVVNASLGDMPAAASAVQSHYSPSVATASSSGLGFFGGGEAGISLDPENAIGLAVNLGIFGGYKDSGTILGNTFSDSYAPMMLAIEPLYHRFLLMGNSRIRLEAGPGLYMTSLQAGEVQNGTTVLSGSMTGFGFGGCLGAGWDIALGNFSLELFAHGRLASTSNIQGQFQDPSGNTYQVGLAMNSQNFIGTANTSYIGNGSLRWANVDYTGFDLGLGASYQY